MKPVAPWDLPPHKQRALRHARRLELLTVAYIASSATLLGLTMGGSQAMRTSFFEELISVVPAVAFLVCSRIARRWPTKEYPYGFHGAVSIGYLTASLALLAMGAFLIGEAAVKLVKIERTTIGGMTLFGHTFWAGWPMLAAVVYAGVPAFFLGRAKLRQAPRIHDKILYADAQMMKADWRAESATAVGVLGVGLGFWWLDPLAAALVSLGILKDGVTNVRVACGDLIERRPMRTDRSAPEPLPAQLETVMRALPWVESAEVRLREVGHVFFGEIFVVARDQHELPRRIREAALMARRLNWRLHEVTITLCERPGTPCDERGDGARVAARKARSP